MIHHTPEDEQYIPPTPAGLLEMMPPPAYPHAPITSLCAKFVHVSTNKRRFPVHVVRWTPDGRRLITGAQNGEFTLWNGAVTQRALSGTQRVS
jgi:polyadenylation factor subunit 2